ncbi:class I SAM-dependent methyltransferase [Prevotella sp. 10(H)]|uniref:class I SAM-dependent methyltransferase n=1 Tax=Prevotella sp. 10(H) TaxID=1158294 RepID=UPI0004A76750|nr:class I SAM-dependent methyltransferase [Prevotella sp. 10(H)]
MPRIYKLSKTGLKLLYKIRHHRGHGIHSPFVFDLITKVIEDKTPYQAYKNIKSILDNSQTEKSFRLDKLNKLTYRLANHFEVKHVLDIGAGYGINTVCMTAPFPDSTCTSVEMSDRKYTLARKIIDNCDRKIDLYTGAGLPALKEKQDCIFIDLNNYSDFLPDINNYLSELSHQKTFIIVKGIRTNKRYQMLWRNIISMESRTAVLDLFNVGIIFFDKRLYRWDYQISF